MILHLAGAVSGEAEANFPLGYATLPGAAVTVAQQIVALTRHAGPEIAALIRDTPDPATWTIVQTLPRRFAATRARALWFQSEDNFDQILQASTEDDLPHA